ncbi:MAG: hypothetical protein QF415_15520 [Candidatus Undinarchaeales archaeon]|jgi:hypothetical protein|nr:hypothetical protein [Candidatus Undinarchaeales archaeon]MDP7493208.1 hypothetical protein [Candidatus Undinarchaeales archaeon]
MIIDVLDDLFSLVLGSPTCPTVLKTTCDDGRRVIAVRDIDGTEARAACLEECSLFTSELCPCVTFWEFVEELDPSTASTRRGVCQ